MTRRAAALSAALVFFCSPAFADDVSSRDTAGAQEARFREERERLRAASEASFEESPAVRDETVVQEEADTGTRFRVTDVRISGNYSIPDKELRPYVEPLLNGEVTLTDVRRAVDGIKRHYRSKGYVAVYVYTPPQQLRGGALKIDVMEGRLGNLEVQGGKWFSQAQVRRLFPVTPGEVIRYGTLRRPIDRLNEGGDLRAKAVLAPGKAVGTTDVKIEVEDRAPYHLAADVNNSGTRNTGRERYSLSASHDNLFGNFERLDGNVQLGKSVESYGAGYSVPVNDPKIGQRLGYSFSYGTVDVGGSFAPLGVEGDSETHRGYLSQPVWEKENFRVDATAAVDVKHVENRLLGQISGKDDLFIPNLTIDVKSVDDGGVTVVSNRLNGGLADFLGSSKRNDPIASRAGTGGDFFYYRGTAVRYQKLPDGLLLSVRGTLQLSPDPLSPSEQLSLGGARSVRGYQEGEYLADGGGIVSVDLYVPAVFLPDEWRLPWAKETLEKQIQLILFADFGAGSLKKPLVGERKNRELAGFGGGFRVKLYDNFYGRFEWAAPVGDPPFDHRDKIFYFTLSYEFL